MKQRIKKIPTLLLGVLCAVGVHMVLFTDSGHRLQSAIIESDTTSHAEAHLVASEENLSFKVNVTATNVTKIEGTLSYDDTSLLLANPTSPLGKIAITEEGFSKKVSLTFGQPQNIRKGDTIITWAMSPILPEVRSINLTEVSLFMTDGIEQLTTEGTGEF
ncbi:hypothetical protein KBB89_00175 [Candidatus Gracilibacteria bacterium]|nr:hypothetical protein [Candidatus Gracilibacteria bacterium]